MDKFLVNIDCMPRKYAVEDVAKRRSENVDFDALLL